MLAVMKKNSLQICGWVFLPSAREHNIELQHELIADSSHMAGDPPVI